jgi:hypothetical protein
MNESEMLRLLPAVQGVYTKDDGNADSHNSSPHTVLINHLRPSGNYLKHLL